MSDNEGRVNSALLPNHSDRFYFAFTDSILLKTKALIQKCEKETIIAGKVLILIKQDLCVGRMLYIVMVMLSMVLS